MDVREMWMEEDYDRMYQEWLHYDVEEYVKLVDDDDEDYVKWVDDDNEEDVKRDCEEGVKRGGEEGVKRGGEEDVKRGGEEDVKRSGEEDVKRGGEEDVKHGGEEDVKRGGEEGVKRGGEEDVKLCGEKDVKRGGEEDVKRGGEDVKRGGKEDVKRLGEKEVKRDCEEDVKRGGEEDLKRGGEEDVKRGGEEDLKRGGEGDVKRGGEGDVKRGDEEDVKRGDVDIAGSPPDMGDEHNSNFMFDPPLYIQRYMRVSEIIASVCSRDGSCLGSPSSSSDGCRVADLGCSEMAFFRYLKQIPGVTAVQLVDVCGAVLRRCADRVVPSLGDCLQQRVRPLHVQVLCGSVAERDARLAGCDVVSAIELVEHLHEEELSALPATIFGFIQPRLAVLTTPNREFNVVFKMAATDRRHYDHKFEWTREEFAAWCGDVVTRYPEYDLTLEGVGAAPDEFPDVGCCSQLAVFRRRSSPDPASSTGPVDFSREGRPYQLIRETVYRHRCAETLLLGSVDFWTRQIAHGRRDTQLATEREEERDCDGSSDDVLVELSCILSIPSIAKLCGSAGELGTILRKHKRSIVERDGIQYIRYHFDDEPVDDSDF